MTMGEGMAVTFDAGDASSSHRALADAFGLKEETARFRGALQFFASLEDGDPPVWRTIGTTNGVYSAVTAMGDARFLFTHPRVTKVRVLKFSDVTE